MGFNQHALSSNAGRDPSFTFSPRGPLKQQAYTFTPDRRLYDVNVPPRKPPHPYTSSKNSTTEKINKREKPRTKQRRERTPPPIIKSTESFVVDKGEEEYGVAQQVDKYRMDYENFETLFQDLGLEKYLPTPHSPGRRKGKRKKGAKRLPVEDVLGPYVHVYKPEEVVEGYKLGHRLRRSTPAGGEGAKMEAVGDDALATLTAAAEYAAARAEGRDVFNIDTLNSSRCRRFGVNERFCLPSGKGLYHCPNGWERYKLRDIPKGGTILYHGTSVDKVGSIIRTGLRKPGEFGLNGAHIQNQHGHVGCEANDVGVYTSRSVWYAGVLSDAVWIEDKQKRLRKAVVVLEVAAAATFETQGNTLDESLYPRDRAHHLKLRFDENVAETELECVHFDSTDLTVTAIMVHFEDDREYHSSDSEDLSNLVVPHANYTRDALKVGHRPKVYVLQSPDVITLGKSFSVDWITSKNATTVWVLLKASKSQYKTIKKSQQKTKDEKSESDTKNERRSSSDNSNKTPVLLSTNAQGEDEVVLAYPYLSRPYPNMRNANGWYSSSDEDLVNESSASDRQQQGKTRGRQQGQHPKSKKAKFQRKTLGGITTVIPDDGCVIPGDYILELSIYGGEIRERHSVKIIKAANSSNGSSSDDFHHRGTGGHGYGDSSDESPTGGGGGRGGGGGSGGGPHGGGGGGDDPNRRYTPSKGGHNVAKKKKKKKESSSSDDETLKPTRHARSRALSSSDDEDPPTLIRQEATEVRHSPTTVITGEGGTAAGGGATRDYIANPPTVTQSPDEQTTANRVRSVHAPVQMQTLNVTHTHVPPPTDVAAMTHEAMPTRYSPVQPQMAPFQRTPSPHGGGYRPFQRTPSPIQPMFHPSPSPTPSPSVPQPKPPLEKHQDGHSSRSSSVEHSSGHKPHRMGTPVRQDDGRVQWYYQTDTSLPKACQNTGLVFPHDYQAYDESTSTKIQAAYQAGDQHVDIGDHWRIHFDSLVDTNVLPRKLVKVKGEHVQSRKDTEQPYAKIRAVSAAVNGVPLHTGPTPAVGPMAPTFRHISPFARMGLFPPVPGLMGGMGPPPHPVNHVPLPGTTPPLHGDVRLGPGRFTPPNIPPGPLPYGGLPMPAVPYIFHPYALHPPGFQGGPPAGVRSEPKYDYWRNPAVRATNAQDEQPPQGTDADGRHKSL